MSEKKTAEQEAREMECRVRALARHLLNSFIQSPVAFDGQDSLLEEVWSLAEKFEAQAEERWRKLQ